MGRDGVTEDPDTHTSCGFWKDCPDSDQQARWTEVARATAVGSEWVEDLRGPARRLLSRPRPVRFPDVEAVAGRVLSALDQELDSLDTNEKNQVLNRLCDQFAARIAELEAA